MMFRKLPLEIILNITSHLAFGDKLNLKTTCVELNNLISTIVLYEDLNLLHIEHSVKDDEDSGKPGDVIIEKLINDKFDGSIVKVLRIDMNVLSNHIISQLPDLFPNIKRIITSERSYGDPSYKKHKRRFDHTTSPLTKWRNTITKMDFPYDWHELLFDLLEHKYPRLTELRIKGSSFVFDSLAKNRKLSFFTNAPLLTTLLLHEAEITLEILEAIHSGFPLLKTLELCDTSIDLKKNTRLPLSIVPASTVTYFGLIYSKDFNKSDVVLEYILKKYTNLQKLVYCINPNTDYRIIEPGDRRHYEHRYHRPELDFDELRSKSKENFQMYSAFESNFFSRLPRSINTLTMKTLNMDVAVAALADSDNNITSLDLLAHTIPTHGVSPPYWMEDPFVESDILNYIKKLSSLNILKIPINLTSKDFTPTFISSSVTKLSVVLYGQSISIEAILSMFPALQELHVYKKDNDYGHGPRCQIKGREDDDQNDMDAKREPQPSKVYPKLRILNIQCYRIHPGFFPFVKAALPNLEELDMYISLRRRKNSRIHEFSLSDYALNRCNLAFTGATVYCTVIMQNASRRFLGGQSSTSLRSVPEYSMIEECVQYVEITADRIKNLKIFGFPIVKVGENILIDI